MKEKEVVEKLVNILSEIEDATTIASTDFTEERENNMIVVGVENTTQVNVGLPDYEYRVSIVIDCFIEGDENAETFEEMIDDKSNRVVLYCNVIASF